MNLRSTVLFTLVILTFQLTLFICPSYSIAQTIYAMENRVWKGTTIITSVLKDKIIIAADSKITSLNSSVDSGEEYTFCKIRHVENLFFAASGKIIMASPDINIVHIIESMDLSMRPTFNEKLTFIETMLQPHIKQLANNLAKYHRKFFDSAANRFLIQIIFATFESSKPVAAIINWNVENTVNGHVISTTKSFNNSTIGFTLLGQKDSIQTILKNYPELTKSMDEITLNYLIETQIKASPKTVGLPIDIVVLTKDGYKWIKKKLECK